MDRLSNGTKVNNHKGATCQLAVVLKCVPKVILTL